jgi:hypothetical protein
VEGGLDPPSAGVEPHLVEAVRATPEARRHRVRVSGVPPDPALDQLAVHSAFRERIGRLSHDWRENNGAARRAAGVLKIEQEL